MTGHRTQRTMTVAAGYQLCPSCGLRAIWQPCCLPFGATRQPETTCCDCLWRRKERLGAETARLLEGET
jgi:hypothetical protein